MTEQVWLDGRLLPAEEAVLDVRHARAIIAGRGVYETLRVDNAEVLRFDAHMERLAEGAQRLGLEKPDRRLLREAIRAVVQANSIPAARVRLDLQRTAEGKTSALIAATLLPPLPAEQSLCTVPWRRNERSPLAGIKYSACPENSLAQEAARAAGCDEALFLNTRGEVCEGAYSNIFAVIAGTLTTPPLDSGCLPGIMRQTVLAHCRRAGLPCAERAVLPAELAAAGCTELFLTSTIHSDCVVLDRVFRLGTGTDGAVTVRAFPIHSIVKLR